VENFRFQEMVQPSLRGCNRLWTISPAPKRRAISVSPTGRGAMLVPPGAWEVSGLKPRFKTGEVMRPVGRFFHGVSPGGGAGPNSRGLSRHASVLLTHQACFIALANMSGGSVLRTSSLVSQARRACNTPKRIFSMCEMWWESVLITIFTPCCFAWRN
jgi:hypothetical protein